MIRDYFGEVFKSPVNYVITDKNFLKLHRQHHDWTCSVACLRSILKLSMTEDEFVTQFAMTPGPFYSKDFVHIRQDFKDWQFRFGCEDSCMTTVDRWLHLLLLLGEGYSIMIETMYNVGHWLILLGYYPNGEKLSDASILLWDPYLNETRLENAEEVISMWLDGECKASGIEKDYIAVKRI